MPRTPFAVLALLAAGFPGMEARAQDSGANRPVPVGARARLTMPAGHRVTGRVIAYRADSMFVQRIDPQIGA